MLLISNLLHDVLKKRYSHLKRQYNREFFNYIRFSFSHNFSQSSVSFYSGWRCVKDEGTLRNQVKNIFCVLIWKIGLLFTWRVIHTMNVHLFLGINSVAATFAIPMTWTCFNKKIRPICKHIWNIWQWERWQTWQSIS